MREELRDLVLTLVFGLPIAAAVAGLCGYGLARRALAPVHRMTERARWITAERLDDRLPVDNPDDEMGRLATVFNETLGHLESSFGQMRRFTADVSHQLRTPLTAIRTVGEVGLRDQRNAVAYRGIIGSMLEEVDHLSGLVDRLLALSRAETGQARLTADEIDLRELAEEVSSHLGVLADEKHQSIYIEATGSPRCRGDRLVLRQALVNLVHNAIRYGPEGGRIGLGIAESSGRAIIDITDTGPGIPAETHARLFERFGAGARRRSRQWRRRWSRSVDCALGRRSERRTPDARGDERQRYGVPDHASGIRVPPATDGDGRVSQRRFATHPYPDPARISLYKST